MGDRDSRPRVVFFTGAGISRSCGVPTFRERGGLWDLHDPDVVCSRTGFLRDRWRVANFHNDLRRIVEKAQPSPAHLAIAALETHAQVAVVTQNVDDLHERAGTSTVLKLHGDLMTARLKRYRDPTLPWKEDITKDSFPAGWPGCRGTMRHDVVLFGEPVRRLREAESAIRGADHIIVCGTTLLVHPAAGLILDGPVQTMILVDPSPQREIADLFGAVIASDADQGVPEAIRMVMKTWSEG